MLDTTDAQFLTPGEHLKLEMRRHGFDQASLAQAVGVSRQVINYSVNDRKPISRALAAELGRVMGLPEDYWLRSEFRGVPSDQQHEKDTAANSALVSSSLLVDFQIEDAISRGLLEIEPFDGQSVRQASLDFTLSSRVLRLDATSEEISDDAPFVLEPGAVVNCATQERINLKNQYVGRIGATTSLSRQGIHLLHGLHVDPGFDGSLQFCLANMGNTDFQLHVGMVCLSMEVSKLQSRPRSSFYDPFGGRRSTEKILQERQAVQFLFNALRPHLERDLVLERTQAGYRAGIETLIEMNCEYSDRDDTEDAFFTQVKRRLAALFEGHGGKVLDDFRKSLVGYLSNIKLTEKNARKQLENFGVVVNSNADGLVTDSETGEQLFVELPTAKGTISLYSLLVQLDFLPLGLGSS